MARRRFFHHRRPSMKTLVVGRYKRRLRRTLHLRAMPHKPGKYAFARIFTRFVRRLSRIRVQGSATARRRRRRRPRAAHLAPSVAIARVVQSGRSGQVTQSPPPRSPQTVLPQPQPQLPKGSWDHLFAYIPDMPQHVPRDQIRLWWVVDPRDTQGCCEDCRDLAARSPYVPPWLPTGPQLKQTCGDGRTRCGAACTCHLSYWHPGWISWMPIEQVPPAARHQLETPWQVQEEEES